MSKQNLEGKIKEFLLFQVQKYIYISIYKYNNNGAYRLQTNDKVASQASEMSVGPSAQAEENLDTDSLCDCQHPINIRVPLFRPLPLKCVRAHNPTCKGRMKGCPATRQLALQARRARLEEMGRLDGQLRDLWMRTVEDLISLHLYPGSDLSQRINNRARKWGDVLEEPSSPQRKSCPFASPFPYLENSCLAALL